MLSIAILAYYVIAIVYIVFLFKRFKLCPELIWCVLQLIMFYGIVEYSDYSNSNDKLLIVIYLIALICFIASNIFFRAFSKPGKISVTKTSNLNYNKRKIVLFLIIIVCVGLSAFFFLQGGGNVFIKGLQAMISGEQYSTKYSRMKLLSISGVGYIYQLRVIILPLSVLYYVFINKKKVSSFILVTITILFLIGTGQRGGLVSALAIALLSVYYYVNSKKKNSDKKPINKKKIYISVILVAISLFGLSTVMNGRSVESGGTMAAITQRLFRDNQVSAINGFRYIRTQPIQYGNDWRQQLLDILPGKNNYVSLDTRIFAYMYGGSTDGTSPPCIWGSAYYNFGIFGVLFISAIISYISVKIHQKFSNKKCDALDIIIYSALQFLLAYWVASGPIALFNNGFISTLFLYLILNIPLMIDKKRNGGTNENLSIEHR